MKTLFVLLLTAFAAAPQFEVASVRLTDPTGEHGVSLSLRLEPSQVRISALPLRDLIALAYRVQPGQVIGPDWLQSTGIDIVARLPAGAQAQQAPEMLQALLAERFGLVVHREKRETATYALVIGKPPLRLQKNTRDPVPSSAADTVTWALSANPSGVSNDRGNGSSYSFAGGQFEGRGLTTDALASELSRYSSRLIVDKTQLTGRFDMSFAVSPDAYRQLLVRAAYNSGMSIPPEMLLQMDTSSDRLEEAVSQLGLKLESRRLPVDVLVIDAVRRNPTDN
jgi:uncharacterized protein (TIGR03435 family)